MKSRLVFLRAATYKNVEEPKKYKGSFEVPNLSEENEPQSVDVSDLFPALEFGLLDKLNELFLASRSTFRSRTRSSRRSRTLCEPKAPKSCASSLPSTFSYSEKVNARQTDVNESERLVIYSLSLSRF